MNIKNLLLLVSLSAAISVANAGTLTIKAPPDDGLTLLTNSGTLKHGDKDLVLHGVSVTNENISPVVGPDIVGFITLFRSEGPEWLYGNSITCDLEGKYELKIEVVGFKTEVCKDGYKNVRQLRSEGSSDVVLTFTPVQKIK